MRFCSPEDYIKGKSGVFRWLCLLRVGEVSFLEGDGMSKKLWCRIALSLILLSMILTGQTFTVGTVGRFQRTGGQDMVSYTCPAWIPVVFC